MLQGLVAAGAVGTVVARVYAKSVAVVLPISANTLFNNFVDRTSPAHADEFVVNIQASRIPKSAAKQAAAGASSSSVEDSSSFFGNTSSQKDEEHRDVDLVADFARSFLRSKTFRAERSVLDRIMPKYANRRMTDEQIKAINFDMPRGDDTTVSTWELIERTHDELLFKSKWEPNETNAMWLRVQPTESGGIACSCGSAVSNEYVKVGKMDESPGYAAAKGGAAAVMAYYHRLYCQVQLASGVEQWVDDLRTRERHQQEGHQHQQQQQTHSY